MKLLTICIETSLALKIATGDLPARSKVLQHSTSDSLTDIGIFPERRTAGQDQAPRLTLSRPRWIALSHLDCSFKLNLDHPTGILIPSHKIRCAYAKWTVTSSSA